MSSNPMEKLFYLVVKLGYAFQNIKTSHEIII